MCVVHPHVVVDQAVLGGAPHVAGSCVPVLRLWQWHRGGASVETLVKRYPNLGPARILDALSFAYDNQAVVAWEAECEAERLRETRDKVLADVAGVERDR